MEGELKGFKNRGVMAEPQRSRGRKPCAEGRRYSSSQVATSAYPISTGPLRIRKGDLGVGERRGGVPAMNL